MSKIITETWHRMVPGRIVLITMVLLGVSFGLLLFLVSAGDSDLPPYQPQTGAERLCGAVLAIVWWPVAAAGWAFGLHGDVLALPLCFLGVVFWAGLTEFLLSLKNARRT